jgi:hypothetical protein
MGIPMAGNVYVFNATPNAMLLILNNHIAAANVAGVQQSSAYAPQSVTIARNPSSGDSGQAQFGGINTLIVSFPSGTSQTYPIVIDPNDQQINNDLELYIFFNECVLVSPAGTASPQGQKNIQGQALSAAHAADLRKKFSKK